MFCARIHGHAFMHAMGKVNDHVRKTNRIGGQDSDMAIMDLCNIKKWILYKYPGTNILERIISIQPVV